MDDMLAVVVNGELVLQYDRAKPLPGRQRDYLDGMDERMDRGIELNDVRIDAPTSPNALSLSRCTSSTLSRTTTNRFPAPCVRIWPCGCRS